ncbi:helix-turn-helix domain-containing protein [Actinoplanes sp. NPDC026623]|jgi:AcrR family transcriptional regulator|uniref:TetR/AcrR family transcriptional regulator n=1 Tax=Actinoplanes sp. NPDC026623 TaxID=3155610 RepID=UPI0033C3B088
MPRLNTDTREEVKTVALRLFSTRGFEQTSLREIAEELGITKAALYYHFASKHDLLSALITPLVEDLQAFFAGAEARARTDQRGVLEDYFDMCARHRQVFAGLLRDVQVLSELDLVATMIHWRSRLDAMLVGDDPVDRVRAVVALGGLQDCVILFPGDAATAAIRTHAIDAALRALTPHPSV